MVKWSNNWQRGWSNATGKTSPQVVQSRWQTTGKFRPPGAHRQPTLSSSVFSSKAVKHFATQPAVARRKVDPVAVGAKTRLTSIDSVIGRQWAAGPSKTGDNRRQRVTGITPGQVPYTPPSREVVVASRPVGGEQLNRAPELRFYRSESAGPQLVLSWSSVRRGLPALKPRIETIDSHILAQPSPNLIRTNRNRVRFGQEVA